MNIIEAIKSGKPFKRPCFRSFHTREDYAKEHIFLSDESLIADDWECYEPKVNKTVTLYRYTYKQYSGSIIESNYVSISWDEYHGFGVWELLKTESKEIEIEVEE